MTERKLASGQKFVVSSREHARWQDAGKFVAEHPGIESNADDLSDSQDDLILVKNTTGRDLPRFSVLGLRGVLQSPNYSPEALVQFKNNYAMKGEAPDEITRGKFAVLQEPARPDEWVRGKISGVTPVLLNVAHTLDRYADIESTGDTTRVLRTSNQGSAQLMFVPEQTGEQWGYVRLGNRQGWTGAFLQGLVTSTFTPTSSPHTFTDGWTTLSTGDGNQTFTLDSNGYLTLMRPVAPLFMFGWAHYNLPYRRNQVTAIEIGFQTETAVGSGSWIQTGQLPAFNYIVPDIAAPSGSGTSPTLQPQMTTSSNRLVGIRWRPFAKVTYGGTFSPDSVTLATFYVSIHYKI